MVQGSNSLTTCPQATTLTSYSEVVHQHLLPFSFSFHLLQDLDRSRDYVEHWVLDKVHSSRITRLQYAARGSRLVSCSEDAEAPLVIRDIHCKLKVYTFQVTKA